MPNPSEIKASQVNYELNSSFYPVSNTAQLTTANNWVKNVASVSSSTNFQYGRLRWGINFPGVVQNDVGVNVSTPYAISAKIDLSAQILTDISSDPNATAFTYFYLYSNGVFTTETTTTYSGGQTQVFNRIWLTSGVNSDYTANLHITSVTGSGLFTQGGASSDANTDLALSTDRVWVVRSTVSGVGSDADAVEGNLIIKSSGTEIFRRPFSFVTVVDIQP